MPDDKSLLSVLQEGELTVEGRFVRGSNYTFLGRIDCQPENLTVVYKPRRGERPLWDFPSGSLAKREVAAFLVSEALGWGFVPLTIYRRKGPLGPGSVQQYMEHDPEYHYFSFTSKDRQRLRPVALFDLLVNNADRKGSHVIIGKDERIWLIDHGVCFHTQDKLRTVIWDFAGEAISRELLEDLNKFASMLENKAGFYLDLNKYINKSEIKGLISRAKTLIEIGTFPYPTDDRRVYPWPPV